MRRRLLDDPFDHRQQSLESDVNQYERARARSGLFLTILFVGFSQRRSGLFLNESLFLLSHYEIRCRSARKSHEATCSIYSQEAVCEPRFNTEDFLHHHHHRVSFHILGRTDPLENCHTHIDMHRQTVRPQ